MKLDTSSIRYLSPNDWRVLTAVEIGSKNHAYVPSPLISQIAFGSSSSSSSSAGGQGTANRCISVLAKAGLVARDKKGTSGVGNAGGIGNKKKGRGQKGRHMMFEERSGGHGGNDAYRLTYGGLDYLAMHAHVKRGDVESVGDRIGVGKESDIYVVQSGKLEDGTVEKRCLKIHRLGRISFRTVKSNRDYLRNRNTGSWMYMSRLAALKEYAFMKVLYDNGFPVPRPLGQSRHTVLMTLITPAIPLRQVAQVADTPKLFSKLMSLIVSLACHGLIHGDFNEFNLMIYEDSGEPVIIDFPQMVSIDHPNAKEYFERDVECIRRFFERKFKYLVSAEDGVPKWETDVKRMAKLDVQVEASGFSRKQAKELEKYQREVGALGNLNEGENADAKHDAGDGGNDDEDSQDIESEEGTEESEGEGDDRVQSDAEENA